MKIDHYMVDYAGDDGVVKFANDAPIHSLTQAKALASKSSLKNVYGAYVVAYTRSGADPDLVDACGHISFFDGCQSSTDGTVI